MLVASLSAPRPVSRKCGPLRLFMRRMPREDGFFELFARHAETVVGGADALGAMFAGEAGIEESCRRIAEFEHQADTVTRDVLHAVRRTFITPFDRIAIISLISSMDDPIGDTHQTDNAIPRYHVPPLKHTTTEYAAL